MKEFKNYCKHGFAYNTYVVGNDKLFPNSKDEINKKEEEQQEETRLVVKYNITDTSSATTLRTIYEQNMFKSMEIDGVLLDSLVTSYQFSTTGEHIVKYELYDETKVGNNSPLFSGITTLTSVSIPNSVTSIGTAAFNMCSGLTRITIPDSVTTIGNGAFQGCTSLTSITIPDSVTSIGTYAFAGCSNITNITIPNSVTSIGQATFSYCNGLTSVTIGGGVTTIDDYAFQHCSGLTSIEIPNNVTSIGDFVFEECYNLTNITIPNSVTSIGEGTFRFCRSLTNAVINNSIVAWGMLGYCKNLTHVTISDNVTIIYDYAFGCPEYDGGSKLVSITIYAITPPTLTNINAFDDTNNCPIYVPSLSVDTYKAADKWSDLANRIQAIPNN